MDARGAVDLSRQAHERSDVDFAKDSQHHTLGGGAFQAAPGTHKHDILVVGSGTTAVSYKASIASAVNTIPVRDASGDIFSRELRPDGWVRSMVTGVGWYNQVDAMGLYCTGGYVATYPSGTAPFQAGRVWMNTGSGSWIQSFNSTAVPNDPQFNSNRDVALIFSAASSLYANDNARTVWRSMAALSFPVMSSKNVKGDIKPTRFEGIKTVMKFNVKDYLRTEMSPTPEKIETGLIAEEVHEVFPHAVYYEDDAPVGIDYGQLTPLLIQAVQELVGTVKKLNTRISELEAKA